MTNQPEEPSKVESENTELSLDDLEGAAGGYIVDRGYYGSNGRKPYAVVNDKTGKFWNGACMVLEGR